MYRLTWPWNFIMLIIDILGYIIFSPLWLYNKHKKLTKPKKILIIKNDYIGDMILATPFIRNLKQNYPKAKLDIACRSFSNAVLENNPHINKVISFNSPWMARHDSMKWSEVWQFIKQNWRKYDLVVDLHTEPRNILIGKLIGKNLVGYGYRGLGFLLTKKCKTDKYKPIAEQNLDMLKCLGLKIKSKKQELFLTKQEKAKAKKLLGKERFVGIHPGTSDETRQWPIIRFHSLLKELSKQHNLVLLDDDKERAKKVKGNLKIKDLSGKLTLREFFAVTDQLVLLIGLESLAVHVAAAVETPVISIHSCTTRPIVMGPYAKRKIVVHKEVKCQHCGKLFCPKNKGIKKITLQDFKNSAPKLFK
ncbi:glycosyltransferase family 9 protein [Nanoarchaeota archaeon]